MTSPKQADRPERQPEPEPPVNPQLAAAIQRQLGIASLNLAQAVADMCDAIVCREVEKLRTECRTVAEHVYARLDRLEAVALPRDGVPWPPRGNEPGYRVVSPDELAARLEGSANPRARQS